MEVFLPSMVIIFLGILAGASGVLVYYFARKEKNASKRTKKLIHSYIKERAKRQESMNKEIAKLDKLLQNKSIDTETYERLKNVLMTMNEKNRGDTTDLLDYVKSNK